MPNHGDHVIGRRYVLHEALGEGGMGTVYRATDRLTGQQIALKRVHTAMSASTLPASTQKGLDFRLALAREFKLMASLRHPNIVEVLDYGFDHQREPYFTMELLEQARPLNEALKGNSLRDKIRAIVRILHALSFLHRRGILHRDLKPANVLMVGDKVKMLDFGLSVVRDQVSGADESEIAVGTLAYMPPEVLIGSHPSERSDLYSVGVMAYELLTGRHPFDSQDVTGLINHVLYTVPAIDDMDLDLSLAGFILRLMHKQPADRFASADSALDALSRIVDFDLSAGMASHRESFLQSAQFVGREREIGQLTDALRQATHGKGSLWLIGGESGTGKSRLLDELRTRALIDGVTVVSGQAVREGGTPYQVWRMPLGWIGLLGELPQDVMDILRFHVPDVSLLNNGKPSPSLPASLRDPQQARDELIRTITQILRGTTQPLLLILEDLHWAGSESIALLERLAAELDTLKLMIVASLRDDIAPHLMSRVSRARTLRLGRLTEDEIRQLSRAMIGPNGAQPQVIDLLSRESEGNIFFIIEVIRALAEEAGSLDQIGMSTLPEHVISGGAQSIVQHRISRLAPEAQYLLTVAAVIGRQADVGLLQVIAPKIDIDRWLRECTAADLLEADGSDWRFVHDRLRDAVLNQLDDDERRELHATVAQALESHYGEAEGRVAALAYHWGMARDTIKEAHFTRVAGEQSIRSGAYLEALSYLDRTMELIAADDEAVRVEIYNLQAQALISVGRYADARRLYELCLAYARDQKDDLARALALFNLGNISHVQGDYQEARDLYQQSFDLYSSQQDATGMGQALNSLGNVLYDLGEDTEAKALYQQSMQLLREAGSQWGMAGTIRATDDSEEAEQVDIPTVFAEIRAALRDNDPLEAARRLMSIGDPTQERERVRRLLYDILMFTRKHADSPLTLAVLAQIARQLYGDGYYEEALELLAFILHTPELPEIVQDKAENLTFELEEHIAPGTVELLWERGKSSAQDDIIARALAWIRA